METSILRKPLHILLVLAMTASLLATAAVGAFAQTFTDVPDDHPFAEEIGWMVENEITTGFADDTFRPTIDVTRMAAVTFIYRWAGSPDVTEAADFTDIDAVPDEFADAIAWAVEAGITTGFGDDTFRPTNPVTRRAFSAWLFRANGEPEGDFAEIAIADFDDVDADTAFVNEIGWMAANGITTGFGDSTFRPGDNVTRQATAAFLFRYNELVTEGAIDATFTVLAVDASEPEDDNLGTLLLSDGSDLFTFVFDTERDSFAVDGDPSSFAIFAAQFGDLGDKLIEIEVVGDADEGFAHNLVITDNPTSGVVGVEVDGEIFISDFPSGYSLGTPNAPNLWQIEGEFVTEGAFEESVNTGDLLEVIERSEGNYTWNLTNNAPTGEPVDVVEGGIVLDVYGDEDLVADGVGDRLSVEVIPGHIAYEFADDEYEVTLNGDALTGLGFGDVAAAVEAYRDGLAVELDAVFGIEDGATVTIDELTATYGREDATTSFDLVAEVSVIEFTPFEGIVLLEDTGTVTVAVGEDDLRSISPAGDDVVYRVDGTRVEAEAFDEALSLGDRLTCADGDLADPTDPQSDIVDCTSFLLTNDTFTGTVVGVLEVELVNGYVLAVVDPTDPPLGVDGVVEFVIEGDYFTDVAGVGLVVDGLGAEDLDETTVTITLDEGDDDVFAWEFEGFSASVLSDYFELDSFLTRQASAFTPGAGVTLDVGAIVSQGGVTGEFVPSIKSDEFTITLNGTIGEDDDVTVTVTLAADGEVTEVTDDISITFSENGSYEIVVADANGEDWDVTNVTLRNISFAPVAVNGDAS